MRPQARLRDVDRQDGALREALDKRAVVLDAQVALEPDESDFGFRHACGTRGGIARFALTLPAHSPSLLSWA